MNEIISRHDLYTWFVAHFIEEGKRGQALGSLILEHAMGQAAAAGFDSLYLTTDHDGYYEKYGWNQISSLSDHQISPGTSLAAILMCLNRVCHACPHTFNNG